jgi:hypothetical protein
MLGFKSFWSAMKLIAGIETMHMIKKVKKGQLRFPNRQGMSSADQFYSLAFSVPPTSPTLCGRSTLLRRNREKFYSDADIHWFAPQGDYPTGLIRKLNSLAV